MSAQGSGNDYREWLRYAIEDLGLDFRVMSPPEVYPRHACYFAQQAAEKAIKAVLVYHKIDFAFRHDLEYLNRLMPQDWRFDADSANLEQLSDWVVVSRYPGDMPPATEDDARTSLSDASYIVETIANRLPD